MANTKKDKRLPMNNLNDIIKEFGNLDSYKTCPEFWKAVPENGLKFVESLHGATVRVIGQSAGKRDIIALEYGDKEETGATVNNLQSSLASKIANPDPTSIFPEEFYGLKRRVKPVLILQGALHGGELTGTVASLNLCNIIESGVDLRGKAWPELQSMAGQYRLLVIPWSNPDGTARAGIACSSGIPAELYSRLTMGVKKGGIPFKYPENKKQYPVPLAEVAYLGSYYNDNGYNLQYDFCETERQPETKTWMKYYLEEKPDAVVAWHCDNGSLFSMPPALLPVGFQHQVSRIAGAVRQGLCRKGYGVGRLSWAQLPGLGKDNLTQVEAIYHVCGALPLLCELPAGTDNKLFTPDEMLDISLITLEELLFFGLEDGFRPYEYRRKIINSTRE